MSTLAAPTPSNPRWLFGPVSDLLFGCGIAYMGIFALMTVAAEQVEATVPITSFLLITLVIAAPHYGATLLRVYESREDRRAYTLFTIWITAGLIGIFVTSLYSPVLGSLWFTLYMTWSPWHYSGQNYGLVVLFLRRRGVTIEPRAKQLLYASFILSYAIVFVAFHTGVSSTGYGPALPQGDSYVFVPIGIPLYMANALYAGLGGLYLLTTAGTLFLLARGSNLRDLGPALVLIASQALWFAIPGLARASGTLQGIAPLSNLTAPYIGLWIAIAHCVQYLWVTTYYAARDENHVGRTRYLTKALLAGSAAWGVPALLFSPGLLGNVPYNMGLFMMVAATVNLHHFILDGAIWKLRDPRLAKILLRSDDSVGPRLDRGGSSFVRPLFWATGFVCLVIFVVGDLEAQYGVTRAGERGDAARIEKATRRLARIGRDSPKLHHQLALLAQRDGDLVRAETEFKAALEVYETKNVWHNLGTMYLSQQRFDEALHAFDEALALDPSLAQTRVHASTAALSLGQRELALDHLKAAARLAPNDRGLRRRIVELGGEPNPPGQALP
ncbi:MAG: tetratricopeptide repeat protein [Deltaproteobacteria bacterium]|nr:tetratricopeptide repeat protein [Deltaproteobacteria bacterium]